MAIDYSKFQKKSTIDYSKFKKTTTPSTVKTPTSIATPTLKNTFNLNPSLGGGQFNVAQTPGALVTTPRAYGGVEAPGQYREHIFPVALGGTSNIDNIKVYGKDIGAKKTAYETDIIRQFKAGKLDLPEAQGLVLKKYRELTGIDAPTSVIGNLWEGIKKTATQIFPQTTQAIKEVGPSIKSEASKAASTKPLAIRAIEDYAKTLKEQELSGLQTLKQIGQEKTTTKSGFLGKTLETGAAATTMAIAPITSLFGAAKNIPVAGTVMSALNVPFGAIGDIATNTSNQALDSLVKTGVIKKEQADNVRKGVNDITSLAAQIYFGNKLFDSLAGKKKEIPNETYLSLVKEYGKKDAETIIEAAKEKAKLELKSETIKAEPAKIDYAKFKKVEVPKIEAIKIEDPLIQEAKKYKSAEEFVKAQTKQEYRSAHQLSLSDSITADKIDIPTLKEAIRTRNGYLNKYNLSDLKKLEKLQNNPDADITIYRASPKNEINEGDWVTTDKIYANDIKKQNGGKVYSYTVKVKDLRFPKDTETLPSLSMASTFSYSPKASQLTDIWNKAQKTPVIERTTITKEPMIKTSGVAKSIQAKAIEEGMIKQGYQELADYDASTIKQQSEIGSRYNIREITRMVTGESPLPMELKPGTVLSIAQDYAIKNRDAKLMRALASSPLTRRLSESASELSLSRMREKETPVMALNDIIKARQKAAEKRTGKKQETIEKEKKAEVESKKKTIEREKPSKYDWNKLINEIACK